MTRTPCCEKQGLKKGPWTPEEDEKLVKFISSHGEGNWSSVPKRAGLIRCGKSCRLRWANYLRPDLKRGLFSEEEERLILDLHKAIGNRWARIAIELPGRTDNDIKNYWNTRIKRKLRDMGIDPVTHKPLTQADASGRSPKGSRRGPPPGEASRRYARPSPAKSGDAGVDTPRKLQPPRQTRPTSFALHAGDADTNSESTSEDEHAGGDELAWANRRRSSRRHVRVDYNSGNEAPTEEETDPYEDEHNESVGDSSEEEDEEGSGSEMSTEDSMDMGETPASPTSVIRTARGASLDARPCAGKREAGPGGTVRPLALSIPSELAPGGLLLSPGPISPLYGMEAAALVAPQDSAAMALDAAGCGLLSPATLKSTMWDSIEPEWWEVTYEDGAFISQSTGPELPELLMAVSPADGACQPGALIGDLTSFDRPLSAGLPAARDKDLLALVKQEPKDSWASSAETVPMPPTAPAAAPAADEAPVEGPGLKGLDCLWSFEEPAVPQLGEPLQAAAAQVNLCSALQQASATMPAALCPLLNSTQNSWTDFFGASPKWSALAPSYQDSSSRTRDQLAGLVGLLSHPANARWSAGPLLSLATSLGDC